MLLEWNNFFEPEIGGSAFARDRFGDRSRALSFKTFESFAGLLGLGQSSLAETQTGRPVVE